MAGELGHQEFFKGLKALAEAAFPKHCRNCGEVFATAEEFMLRTRAIRADITGLKQSVDDDDMTIVEAYRNCSCGSTLMDFFSDRRDFSDAGQRRRDLFDKLLLDLELKGMDRDQGRDYLLQVLRGQPPAAAA